MSLSTKIEAVARSQDVLNLLEHIAWTDTILPALLKHRAGFEEQLVGAVLGNRPVLINGQTVTPEQLAGRIDGLTYALRLIESILARGEKALAELNSVGMSVDVQK